MNWTFSNPALFPLAALIVVPVLVHLFARSRPRAFVFSSTEFIQRIVRSQMHFKRPQDWLLLLIRTLLAAALITLFLQPILLSKKESAVAVGNRSIVLIVDATASMNYPEGVQTRFGAACGIASQQISSLTGADRANIIWLKTNPESVYPEPGVNTAHLQEMVRRARCTFETGSPATAIGGALAQLSNAPGTKEIVVISDFQASNWANVSFAVPADVKLTRIRIGAETGNNGAITAVQADPAQPLLSDSVNLLAEVVNYSPEAARRTVFLEMPDQRQSQEITVPPWGRANALFHIKTTVAGLIPIAFSLNEDAFTADDRRWLVLPVKDHIRVGLFAGDSVVASAWAHALSVLPWVRLQRLSAEELSGDLPFDFVFLAGWNGEGVENLQRVAASGSVTIVCAPKSESTTSNFAQLAGVPVPTASTSVATTFHFLPLKDRMTAEVCAKQDRLFTLFSNSNFGNPASGMVKGRFSISASAWPSIQPLIQYSDAVPALARVAAGQIYLWNIPLDPAQSDWAFKAEFVPLLGELLLTSRNNAESESLVTELEPGAAATFKLNRASLHNTVDLINANGETIPVQSQTDAHGTHLLSDPLPSPGVYAWKLHDTILGYAVVHFPAAESDMRPVEKFSDGIISQPIRAADLLNQPHKESPLWPTLLLICITLLAFESGVLFWIGRRA